MPIEWKTVKMHGKDQVIGRDPYGAWDGDLFGNHWLCGYAIHQIAPDCFELYEDDEKGNGDFIGPASTLEEAKDLAEKHALARQTRTPFAYVRA